MDTVGRTGTLASECSSSPRQEGGKKMFHMFRIRQLSDTEKLEFKNKLIKAGWSIVDENPGIQSPYHPIDTTNWLTVVCPNTDNTALPKDFIEIDDKICDQCGLPETFIIRKYDQRN